MAEKRQRHDEMNPSKRQKTTESDPSSNPYLAHMYPDDAADDQGYENGVSHGYDSATLKASSNGHGQPGGLKHLRRHATTTDQAKAAEDGPNNPFNGSPLSDRYFGILKTRRNLPVHAQRSVTSLLACTITISNYGPERSSSRCFRKPRS